MGVKTACSSQKSINETVADLCWQFGDMPAKAVVYFASPLFDQQALARSMHLHFGNVRVFGCSTAGELISGKMLQNSVVAMAIDDDVLDDIAVEVLPDIRKINDLPILMKRFETYYGVSSSQMDTEKYVGIVLMDGLSGAEGMLLDKLGDLNDLTFIGGSAGDNLQFKATYVHSDGEVFRDAAVLAILKVKNGFDFIKTQSFRTLGRKLVATKVDETAREVMEFDGMPAIDAYAVALGIERQEAHKYFTSNPLGLMAGAEPYVRSPRAANGGTMTFFSVVKKGMELELLQSTDIVKDTTAAVESKLSGGTIAGIINFNCILRALQLKSEGQCDTYGKIFSSVPTIGLDTYGEAYIGHVNQTATMLLLK